MTVILPPFLSFLDWKFGALGNRMRAVTYSISLKPAVLILILKLHTVLLQPENPSIRKINGKYFLCDFRIKNALQNMLINTNNIMKFLTSCTPIQFNSNSNNCQLLSPLCQALFHFILVIALWSYKLSSPLNSCKTQSFIYLYEFCNTRSQHLNSNLLDSIAYVLRYIRSNFPRCLKNKMLLDQCGGFFPPVFAWI